MGSIKFTFVKLIAKFCVFLLAILLFSNVNSLAGENSVVENTTVNVTVDTLQIKPTESTSLNSTSGIIEKLPGTKINTGAEQPKEGNSFLDIFLSTEEITAFKKHLIEYANNHVPRNVRPLYIGLVEKSFDHSIIFIFVGLILFFIVNIVAVLFIFNYSIKRKSYKERFDKIYRKMYEEVLLAYIFGTISWETADIKLKQKNRRANRKILISILMSFKSNFKGELELIIIEIYTKLGLHQDSLAAANSFDNYRKVRGIMELTHLYPEGAKGIISNLINAPNDYVRSESQIAYIQLNSEKPFSFFYTLEKPFTKWTQLSAFNLIRMHQLPVPTFTHFLLFKHYNIRNFSLRMITYFQQLENIPLIIGMVETELDDTRFLAYKAINDLRLYDSRELIKGKFESEPEKNKLEIIKAFRNIGSVEDFDFLEAIMKSGTISMKTEACRSMYYMSHEGREKLLATNSSVIPEIQLLIAHVTDSRN